jgi:hypothetical protein
MSDLFGTPSRGGVFVRFNITLSMYFLLGAHLLSIVRIASAVHAFRLSDVEYFLLR